MLEYQMTHRHMALNFSIVFVGTTELPDACSLDKTCPQPCILGRRPSQYILCIYILFELSGIAGSVDSGEREARRHEKQFTS